MMGSSDADENDIINSFADMKMENRIHCFEKKEPAACFTLGNIFSQAESRFDKAAKLYQHSCDTYKHGPSCYYLSHYFLNARGKLRKDTKKFLEYGEVGCNAGTADACRLLGRFFHPDFVQMPYVDDSDMKMKDFHKSMQYFEKACKNNNGHSCFMVGKAYLTGAEEFNFGKNFTKALTYNIKACERGEEGGCFLAHKQYKHGQGAQADEKLSQLFLEKFNNLDREKYRQKRADMF